MEAYACLCPAIISNTSCFPEIAADAAAYFNPYSEIEIADTIASVIYNPTLRTDLIHKGSEQIKLYSWEKLLSKQNKYISRPWKTKTNKEIIGMRKPVLSIITVNLNNNLGLQKTLRSIQSQSYTDYEHIIIDANSTDGSLETIIKYTTETSHLSYWISEPDKGIYDGMNKGIAHAKGEYIFFLNSGDFLFDDHVLDAIPFDETQYICGNLRILYSNTEYEDIIPPEEVDGLFY